MGEEAAGKRWVRRGCIRRGSGGAGEGRATGANSSNCRSYERYCCFQKALDGSISFGSRATWICALFLLLFQFLVYCTSCLPFTWKNSSYSSLLKISVLNCSCCLLIRYIFKFVCLSLVWDYFVFVVAAKSTNINASTSYNNLNDMI